MGEFAVGEFVCGRIHRKAWEYSFHFCLYWKYANFMREGYRYWHDGCEHLIFQINQLLVHCFVIWLELCVSICYEDFPTWSLPQLGVEVSIMKCWMDWIWEATWKDRLMEKLPQNQMRKQKTKTAQNREMSYVADNPYIFVKFCISSKRCV